MILMVTAYREMVVIAQTYHKLHSDTEKYGLELSQKGGAKRVMSTWEAILSKT